MQVERGAVREVVNRLAQAARNPLGIELCLHESDFEERLTRAGAGQEPLQDELLDAAVLVCIFGERLGTPLPEDFAPAELGLEQLIGFVQHPWSEIDRTAIPATGTLYEYLYGRAMKMRTLVFIKGDSSALAVGQEPDARKLGNLEWYGSLQQGGMLLSEEERHDYDRQKRWLCRFIDVFHGLRAHFFSFRDPEDLKSQLQERLAATLGLGLNEAPSLIEGLSLTAAASSGDVEQVGALLEHGADPHKRESGARPLERAAHNGHGAVVERLLAHDAELLDLPGLDGQTALMTAASRGHAELVRDLLARGANPCKRDRDGMRALDLAARQGHLAVVQTLLAHYPQLLEPSGFEHTAPGGGISDAELVRGLLERRKRQQPSGIHALDWAAAEGHQALVEQLLAHEPLWLELPGLEERTALMAAASKDHLELVRALLDRGADPRYRGDGGMGALHIAAWEGHRGVVDVLLAHDPELLDLPGYREGTALLEAADRGHTELVCSLLERGADVRKQDCDGARALDSAAREGRQEVVEVLLAHEPELLDLPGFKERTALMAAARGGHLELMLSLLERGADPRKVDAGGARALVHAAANGDRRAVEALLALDPELLNFAGPGESTALVAAARNGHFELVRNLLERGADPYKRGAEGAQALDWAAHQGHQAVVELLLAHDPELLDLPGFQDRTVLVAAAGNGHLELVRDLLERGVDPRKRSTVGGHALESAAKNGHQAVVEMLLAYDPDVLDLPGFQEATALMRAAGGGHLDLTRALLERGADPRKRDGNGFRALEYATVQGDQTVVELLLAHDAELLDLPGYRDGTALTAAAAGGHLELAHDLLERGADPRKRTCDGARPLDVAALFGRREVMQLLLSHDPQLVSLPGFKDLTALAAAAEDTHAEIHSSAAHVLKADGADPLAAAADGIRVIDMLITVSRCDLAQEVLETHPHLINVAGVHGATPLMLAAGTFRDGFVSWLLDHGADSGMLDESGNHALLYALNEGAVECAKILIAHDPRLLQLAGEGGRTPAAVIAQAGGPADLLELTAASSRPSASVAPGPEPLAKPAVLPG